jgi:hypothetical protein
MMLYPMEVFVSPRWSSFQDLPAKMKGWVENVHSRPQYKRVRLVGIDIVHLPNRSFSGVGEGRTL